jgi:hypothetical protein
MQSTTKQNCVNVSHFGTYPLREKWVGHVATYNRSNVGNVSLGFAHTHFVRSGSVMLSPALCALDPLSPDRLQHHVPTSHEVGMWSARRASS